MEDTYRTHELKTWPVFYQAIVNGSKTFEVRKNDRDFQINDILLLREYDPETQQYTGLSIKKKVSYILGDNPFFQINGVIIMGLQPIELPSEEEKDTNQAHEFIPMPKFINIYNGSNERCDMLIGPCSCGGWHHLEDWDVFDFDKQDVLNRDCLAGITDDIIHFAGKDRYNCDIVPDGENKLKIIQLANAWREGAKWVLSQIKGKE